MLADAERVLPNIAVCSFSDRTLPGWVVMAVLWTSLQRGMKGKSEKPV